MMGDGMIGFAKSAWENRPRGRFVVIAFLTVIAMGLIVGGGIAVWQAMGMAAFQ